jgi:D-galacturonate reductase
MPVAVSVYGIRDRFPNGQEGFLWTDARVIWNNGACLNVQNGIGFPDDAPGTNTQGMMLYCRGEERGALLSHSDQYRGLKYSYAQIPEGPGSTIYAEPSPDYFQYVNLGGEGLTPIGYGYRSVEHIVSSIIRLESEPEERRGQLLDEVDRQGIVATPRNSSYNELVIEAGRQSILDGGRQVGIRYGEQPGIG